MGPDAAGTGGWGWGRGVGKNIDASGEQKETLDKGKKFHLGRWLIYTPVFPVHQL